MTKRSLYMKMSLEGTTFIKRCGLQRVVQCWKTLRLFEDIEISVDAYFWKFWQFLTTSKIALRFKSVLLSKMCLFMEIYGSPILVCVLAVVASDMGGHQSNIIINSHIKAARYLVQQIGCNFPVEACHQRAGCIPSCVCIFTCPYK